MGTDQDRAMMDIPMAVATAGVSMSMADVDFTKTSKGSKTDGTQYTMMGLITMVLVAGNLILYIMAFTFVGGRWVTLAGVISFIISPYVVFQRWSLSRQATLRQVHNQLRDEVNKLQEENTVLDGKVTELEAQADRVKHVEENLSHIVTAQGTSVADFVDLVKSNGVLQNEIEQKLMVEILQNLLTTVIRSDLDRNFEISEEELNFLLIRLQGLPSVESLDEAAFRKMVADNGNGIHAIVKICQNLSGKGATQSRLIKVSSRHLVL